MATTVFTPRETKIAASWLNDVNIHVYNEMPFAHAAEKINIVAIPGITSGNVQGALEEITTLAQSGGGGGGGGGATVLSDLTDVDTSGAQLGQVLKYNGSSWAPAEDVTAGGGGTDADTLDGFDGLHYLDYANFSNTPSIPATLGDLTNVSTATPSNGQVLKWSDGLNQWAPATDEQGSGGGGGISEAPQDGTPYARQDASWVSVPTGGSGSLAGTFTSSEFPVFGNQIAMVTIPHGLGGIPSMMSLSIRLVSGGAGSGWSIGDVVVLNPAIHDFDETSSAITDANMLAADATNIYVSITPGLWIMRKQAPALAPFQVNPQDWNFFVSAIRI